MRNIFTVKKPASENAGFYDISAGYSTISSSLKNDDEL
ncbi:hypothetical protein SMSK564_0473 [Streptococcus mitis SK564]|uniref:Uncharacterized protein n=1 Tax=Streptococcus mitis SK564 TaxID=585203 RepID=E1LKU6_STRMT|nr:hypothetical protein SMSK564_0473 [Streptococcus mitis SK564]